MGQVLDERARFGRAMKVRPIKPAEAERLQQLDLARIAANRAFDEELVRLYVEEKISTPSMAAAIGCSVQNLGRMIARRRKWLGENRIPYRRTGMI